MWIILFISIVIHVAIRNQTYIDWTGVSVFMYKSVSITKSLQTILCHTEGWRLSTNGLFPCQLSGEFSLQVWKPGELIQSPRSFPRKQAQPVSVTSCKGFQWLKAEVQQQEGKCDSQVLWVSSLLWVKPLEGKSWFPVAVVSWYQCRWAGTVNMSLGLGLVLSPVVSESLTHWLLLGSCLYWELTKLEWWLGRVVSVMLSSEMCLFVLCITWSITNRKF